MNKNATSCCTPAAARHWWAVLALDAAGAVKSLAGATKHLLVIHVRSLRRNRSTGR